MVEQKSIGKNFIQALLISVLGIFLIDFVSHYFLSEPMETFGYFMIKALLYFIFSLVFLFVLNLNKKEGLKVIIGGVIVASIFGIYYNVLPSLFNFYPYGISLKDLSFLGLGYWMTGLAFGIIHTLSFVVGYWLSRLIIRRGK